MKKTFFVADVHLDSAFPGREQLFLDFLKLVGSESADLYVLGDLFDFWANNKAILAANRPVLTRMRELTEQGSRVYILIGNRDLLLNQKILSPFGILFLGEMASIRLDNKNIFLTHGYLLCTLDIKFQKYKNRVWPLYRIFDKILPGPAENYLARKFILKSKQVIHAQEQSRFQFSHAAIMDCFQQGNDIIMCGHSHKRLAESYGDKTFYALPAWDNHRGGYVLHYNGVFSLCDFPAPPQSSRDTRV
jgi:UDP-2,3-diacylglucosamine hydrolase